MWLPYLPSILGALVQLAKLLYDLARERKGDEIKECSYEIEKARASGNTDRLIELIEKMRKGKSCD